MPESVSGQEENEKPQNEPIPLHREKGPSRICCNSPFSRSIIEICLLSEIGRDQGRKGIKRVFFVAAVGNKIDRRSLDDAER